MYADLTIASEGLETVCSVPIVFEQGMFTTMRHLLYYGTSVFAVSAEGPVLFGCHFRQLCGTCDQSNLDPHKIGDCDQIKFLPMVNLSRMQKYALVAQKWCFSSLCLNAC